MRIFAINLFSEKDKECQRQFLVKQPQQPQNSEIPCYRRSFAHLCYFGTLLFEKKKISIHVVWFHLGLIECVFKNTFKEQTSGGVRGGGVGWVGVRSIYKPCALLLLVHPGPPSRSLCQGRREGSGKTESLLNASEKYEKTFSTSRLG